MELKSYQRNVLADLEAYLTEYSAGGDAEGAFRRHWESKSGQQPAGYVDSLPGTPAVCIKVPTGGGKTFIACNALKVIMDALPDSNGRPVVWFVPSLSILDQTVHAFRDPDHPYRRKLNALFSGRVAIFDKTEALTGAGFDPDTVRRQMSILVVGYDSFRSSTKEGRKVYQKNGSLTAFTARYGSGKGIENADETSLAQALNAMRPLVVVDESHNAKSSLSLDMIRNLNPSFVLELTATPRQESNVISSVDPIQLKREQMVKLPVIVYNSRDVNEVVRTAIDLRRRLEHAAESERTKGAPYIRPIVLFQAEPRNQASKERLCGFGISPKEIAIKTADINELKNVDLLTEECPVRYIITVNALKEGWDCPFAYILASLANRSSAVDVEQIVGRILRQPYVTRSLQQFLNLSYVLTASDRFFDTLQHVVQGLNRCGFSDNDYRVKPEQAVPSESRQTEPPLQQADFIEELDPSRHLERKTDQASVPTALDEIETMAQSAAEKPSERLPESEPVADLDAVDSTEIRSMRIEYADAAKEVRLPGFFIKEDAGLFNDSDTTEKFLTRTDLVKGFRLTDQDINLDFRATELDLYEVDVRAGAPGNSRPEYSRLTVEKTRAFTELISHLSEADRKRELFAVIYGMLRKFDEIPEKDIKAYIKRVIDAQDRTRLNDMVGNPYQYAELLKLKVISLMTAHAIESFHRKLTDNSLYAKASWKFPKAIHVPHPTSGIPRSLYGDETEMNRFELDIANEIAGRDNVAFWHRNIERKGFCLNGYPGT